MLELPTVTLIALTNKNIPEHEEAIRRSSAGIKWGATKLIVDYDCMSIDIWNYKIVYELHHYVQTSHAFLFHADGYPINPECWDPKWLELDYIGAPWPLPSDNFSYLDDLGRLQRVGNSVSLRSKKLLEAPTRLNLPWRAYYGYTNEDGFLSCHNRSILESYGCRWASLEEACRFSKEHRIEENKDIEKTFAFHQVDYPPTFET